MDLKDLKKQVIREELEIGEDYGKIFSFIDFANVNNWFEEDDQTWDNRPLQEDEKLEIHIDGLKNFSDIFSERVRVYYGEDPKRSKSRKFTDVLRIVFGKRDVVTKDLQKIKHYLNDSDNDKQQTFLQTDNDGKHFVEIRKCNFDVEIAVDAYKMIDHYDTFCIFSGDADFVYLNNFLRKKKKKVIIIKAGYITSKLKKSGNLVINAQRVKRHIVRINKQKPD